MTRPLRRALLFMPGDDRRKIEKGAGLTVDSVIMDLEDGVALGQKSTARDVILAALREVDFGTTERVVRVNPLHTDFWTDDLAATLPGRPNAYVVPKAENADDLALFATLIDAAEAEHGWPHGEIRLLALVETAMGIVNLRALAQCSSRLDALIFGAEDLAGDMGAQRTPDGREIFYARSALVLHAKAFGLQAIDTPYVQLHDLDGLRFQTEQARQMGYTGKLAIHPRQIDPIAQVFTPTEAEIAYARRVVSTHNQNQASGIGVFDLDGKMVDMPMVKAAETILLQARAAGIIVED